MNSCDCEGCKRGRLPHGGYQPCSRYELGPPPTTEDAYILSARKDSERAIGLEIIPICIFFFSIGMAIGKYVLS